MALHSVSLPWRMWREIEWGVGMLEVETSGWALGGSSKLGGIGQISSDAIHPGYNVFSHCSVK